MDFTTSVCLFSGSVIVFVLYYLRAIQKAPENDVHSYEFSVGERVRFSNSAIQQLSADGEVHTVINVHYVPSSVIGIMNYPVERALVGHPQSVTLENGRKLSGAWLCPVPRE